MSESPLILIGAGHMGGALLRAWVARGLTPIIVVEPRPTRDIRRLAARNRVAIVPDIAALRVKRPRASVIALKPQVLKAEAPKLAALARAGAPVISIAAGTTIASLTSALGPSARIIRAMPNIAGAIGRGISGLYAGKNATAKDRTLAETLLAAIGETVWIGHEKLIDTVTAVSGSGPAYVFLMVEALADAGEREGLPRAVARKLARATLIGAGALLANDGREPAELRASVTSPHGTTAAALSVLVGRNGLKPLVARAVRAARKRGAELGR